MAIPAGAVLVKDYKLRPKVFRVTLCMNHLSYGKYDAYEQPGGMAYVTNISNTLENLQKTVDGYIETVTLCSDLVIICNEEGRLKGLPSNCSVAGVDFVGTIVFAGIDEDEFCDVPMCYSDAKRLFPHLWEED